MRIIKLTCELNKHQIMTSVDEIFTSKGSRYAALLFLEAAKLARPVPLCSLADEPARPVPETGQAGLPVGFLSNRLKLLLIDAKADSSDWRASIVAYLRDPSVKVDKNVRRSAFKLILHNGEIYGRTAEDLLLKYLDNDQAKVPWEKSMKVFLVHNNPLQR